MNLLAVIKTGFTSIGKENRLRQKHHHRVTLLKIQLLDDDLCVLDTPFWAISQHINDDGIGFLTLTPVTSKLSPHDCSGRQLLSDRNRSTHSHV